MNRNSRTVLGLVGVLACMGALTAAAVPLYDMFCRVTGYGGTPNTATETTGVVLDETEVDAHLPHGSSHLATFFTLGGCAARALGESFVLVLG